MRGYNDSKPVADMGNVSFDDHLEDIRTAMDALDRPALVTHSASGLIALKLAETQPIAAAVHLIAELDAEGHATYNFDLTRVLPTLPHISEVDHVHTGSIAATLEPGGTQVVGALKATHGEATISYDPNARPTLMGDPQDARNRVEEIVVLSDVVKVSDQDVEWFYPDRAIDDVVQDWLALGPSLVVVTRGGEGATFAVRGADPVLAASAEVQMVDTVGAGDSFMAGLLSGLLDAGLLGGEGARVKLGGRPHPAMCSRLCSGPSQRPA